MRCVKSVCLHKSRRSTGLTEFILTVHKLHGSGLVCSKNAGYGLSKAAGHIVLFRYNHCAGL